MKQTDIETKEVGGGRRFAKSESTEIPDSFGLYDIDIDSSFFETGNICFSLNRDIYNFCALLYERNLFSKMKKSHKFAVVIVAIFSWIVQTSSILFIQLLSYQYFGVNDMQGTLICTNTHFYDNNCVFVESDERYGSDFFTNGKPKHHSSLYNVARCISISIVLCYLYSTIASLSTYSAIISISSSNRKRLIWIVITLSQILFVVVALLKIVIFTFYQEKIVDILSVGIGFIILVEIDDILYKSVEDMNPLHDHSKLFNFNIEQKKFKRLTIYHVVDNYIYDAFSFMTLFIATLIYIIVMLWYVPIWTDFWYNYFPFELFGPTICLIVLTPYVVMCFRNKQYKNRY